jgi:hypothetical protein
VFDARKKHHVNVWCFNGILLVVELLIVISRESPYLVARGTARRKLFKSTRARLFGTVEVGNIEPDTAQHRKESTNDVVMFVFQNIRTKIHVRKHY